MFKTIKSKIIFWYTIIILMTFGLLFVIFTYFSEDYYYHKKADVMEDVYDRLNEMDMSQLYKDSSFLMSYEENKLRFVICDETFTPIYVTSRKKDEAVLRRKVNNKIVKRVGRFQPKFKTRVGNTKISGKGLITQGEHTYYVYIYETKIGVKIHFSYLKLFFGVICIMALVISVVLSGFISNRISRPIKNIEKNTKNAIDNGFQINISEKQDFKELSSLARSINIMLEQIREQIHTLEKEIERKVVVEERRRQFVNNVSHEMKTPLAVISSQVQMLELIHDEEKKSEYCKSIIDETSSLSEMINEMILIYSLQNDNETMEQEKKDLSELVSVACERYKDLFESNNIVLHEEYEKNCYAYVNSRFLSQAVDNYITNAVKHCAEHGKIFVRVMQSNDYVRIEVENEGKPVPEEAKDKIWNKFYRGDISESLNGQKGSGLGLYLVKCIVDLHEGNCGYKNLENSVLFYIEILK